MRFRHAMASCGCHERKRCNLSGATESFAGSWHMPAITTRSEHIDHWIKMPQRFARFSGSGPSPHTRSLAGFIIVTFRFRFSVHTALCKSQRAILACTCDGASWPNSRPSARPCAGQLSDLARMLHGVARGFVVGVKVERLLLILAYRGQRPVGIGPSVRVLPYAPRGHAKPVRQAYFARGFCQKFRGVFRIERPDRLDRHSGAALQPVLAAKQAALQGMNALDRNGRAEHVNKRC